MKEVSLAVLESSERYLEIESSWKFLKADALSFTSLRPRSSIIADLT